MVVIEDITEDEKKPVRISSGAREDQKKKTSTGKDNSAADAGDAGAAAKASGPFAVIVSIYGAVILLLHGTRGIYGAFAEKGMPDCLRWIGSGGFLLLGALGSATLAMTGKYFRVLLGILLAFGVEGSVLMRHLSLAFGGGQAWIPFILHLLMFLSSALAVALTLASRPSLKSCKWA
eukprot:TRINITY_DN28284_c0_g1_i1.p1 TRINITY_DN28284_c0_g1~~TRINITY_DN28284_c0_g1_i1.p1  ORF type:complete len:177 (+),score=38.38 TRINITY_DN28284_c0_g1_i1:90-620(+)